LRLLTASEKVNVYGSTAVATVAKTTVMSIESWRHELGTLPQALSDMKIQESAAPLVIMRAVPGVECFGLDLAAVRHSGWVLHGSVLPTELAAPDLPRLAIGMISW
jgi:hypothetical protein